MANSDDEEEFFRKHQQGYNKNIASNDADEDDRGLQHAGSYSTESKKYYGGASIGGKAAGTGIVGLIKTKVGGSRSSHGASQPSSRNLGGKGGAQYDAVTRGRSMSSGGNNMSEFDEDNLSIPSEDELDYNRMAAQERQETRMIRGDSAARAPPSMRPTAALKSIQDDINGYPEPELWDEVDEEELARRVRELRDPRVVTASVAHPATPIIKKTSNVSGIDSLSAGQSELTDPLGLGPINLQTLSLDAHNSTPLMSDDVTAKAEKLLYFEETFNPRVYLAQIHRDTSIQDLEEGKVKLKRDVASHKEELKRLVKDNFDIFISCKSTIDDIHVRLHNMESDKEGAGTRKLNVSIRDCDEVARRAFGPLLERQAQVDRIRSVQGLLQRFRTLFNLPSDLRTFVKLGEYDKAVNEYVKAKSLRLPVNTGILKRVFEEADKVVVELKEALYSHMADPKAELVQVEYKMKLLLELEPESDPVWHYLQLQEIRIRGLLEGAQQEAAGKLEVMQQRVKEREQAEVRWKQLQIETSAAAGSEVDLSLLLGDEHLVEEAAKDAGVEEESDIIHCRLIRRLTAVVKQQIPRFWKLALSIFSGRFANFGAQTNHDQWRSPEVTTFAKTPQRQEDLQGRYAKHSLEEVGAMVLSVLSLYESKVLQAFSQLEQAVELRPYMKEAIGDVIGALTALKQRDSAPYSAVEVLEKLRLDISTRIVQRLCHITRGSVVQLAEEEDWVPAPSIQRLQSSFTISSFPVKFRDTLMDALDHVALVLEQLLEEDGNEMVQTSLKDMRESLRSMFFESFLDFCECLERMSASLAISDQDGGEARDGRGAEKKGDRAEYLGVQVGVEVKTVDQRILMLLSNAGYCRTSVLQQLTLKYHQLWTDGYEDEGLTGFNQRPGVPPDADSMMTELEQHLLELERVLGDKYIEIKANHLGHAVIKYFLEDGTSWATAPPVKGLRDSALELMHPLVAVHAEAYAGCRPFVEKAINMLAEGLMDALNQVAMRHPDLQQLDVNAYCQLSIELDYFETVLQPFASPSLEDVVDQLRDLLRQRTMDNIESLQNDNDSDRPLRRQSRMSAYDDSASVDSSLPQTPEDLKNLADSISADLLPGELRRTKVNVYCFTGRQGDGEGVSNLPVALPPGLEPLTVPPSPFRQSYGQPLQSAVSASSSSSLASRITAPVSLASSNRVPSVPIGASSRIQDSPVSIARRGRTMSSDVVSGRQTGGQGASRARGVEGWAANNAPAAAGTFGRGNNYALGRNARSPVYRGDEE